MYQDVSTLPLNQLSCLGKANPALRAGELSSRPASRLIQPIHSIVQPKEKGPLLHSVDSLGLNTERRNVTQGVPRATTAVFTEGLTIVYTRTRRVNRSKRTKMSSAVKSFHWIILRPPKSTLFPTLHSETFLVFFPPIYRSYTHSFWHS